MDLVRQSFGITLVLLLLWLTVWWLKRRGSSVGFRLKLRDAKGEMESLERLVLTPQHSIHLIRVREQVMAVGLHPSGMTVLTGTDWGQEFKRSLTK